MTLSQYTQYSAWGQQQARSINTLVDTNRLGWKGLMYEGDSTKLYYVRNRWYDPAAGRFVSEDPIGIAGGMNLYTFGGNDPINHADPTGTHEVCFTFQVWVPLDYDNDPDDSDEGSEDEGYWDTQQQCYDDGLGDGGTGTSSGTGGGGGTTTGTGGNTGGTGGTQPPPKPQPRPEPPPTWLTHDWAACGKSLLTTAMSVGLDLATAGEYGEIKAGAKLGEEALDVGLRKLARNGGKWSGHVARAMDRAASSQMQVNISARLLGVQKGFDMQNAVGAADSFVELLPYAGSIYGLYKTGVDCYHAAAGQ